jgi:hypothetical protein
MVDVVQNIRDIASVRHKYDLRPKAIALVQPTMPKTWNNGKRQGKYRGL